VSVRVRVRLLALTSKLTLSRSDVGSPTGPVSLVHGTVDVAILNLMSASHLPNLSLLDRVQIHVPSDRAPLSTLARDPVGAVFDCAVKPLTKHGERLAYGQPNDDANSNFDDATQWEASP